MLERTGTVFKATMVGYLEERRCVQQSSISTKADDEVNAVRDIVKIWKISRNNFFKSNLKKERLKDTASNTKQMPLNGFRTFSESTEFLGNGPKVFIS